MAAFIVLAIVPALLWIWLFYTSNRYKRSSVLLLGGLFIGGNLCGLLALTLNHIIEKYTMFWPGASETFTFFGTLPPLPAYSLGFWFMIGFNEEFAKLVVLLLLAYPSKDFQERFDGVLYATVVAVGFATIENFFYADQYGLPILVTRVLITLPTHIFMSAPMGYYLAQSRFALNRARPNQIIHLESVGLLLKGWAISAFLHGCYDSFLSTDWDQFAYLQLFLMGGMTVFLRRRCLAQSQYAPPFQSSAMVTPSSSEPRR